MSDNLSMHGIHAPKDRGSVPITNLFHRVMLMRQHALNHPTPKSHAAPKNSVMPQRPLSMSSETPGGIFKSVRSNIVQSIRAFKGPDLAREASRLGHHFLYAQGSEAITKAEVLAAIAKSLLFPKAYGKNYDALRTALTLEMEKAGPQPGFVVMLEGLPSTQKFDKDARETLLDVFRDAAEFWAERGVCFRVFYSFALTNA